MVHPNPASHPQAAQAAYILADALANQIYQPFDTIFQLIRLRANTDQTVFTNFQPEVRAVRRSHLIYRSVVELFGMYVVWEYPHLSKPKMVVAL